MKGIVECFFRNPFRVLFHISRPIEIRIFEGDLGGDPRVAKMADLNGPTNAEKQSE